MNEIISTDDAEKPTVSLLNIIAEASRNPDTNIANLQALLQMQREVMADQAKIAFARALWRLKKDMPQIPKNGIIDLGTKGKIKFARWEDMAEVIQPLMDREGFTLSFDTEERAREGGGSVVIGTLTHIDGHSKTARFSLPLDSGPGRNSLQAAGSTLSYGKRYVTELLLNIVRRGEDDDAHAAGIRYITPQQKDELIALIKETNTDTKAYLLNRGVNSLDEIEFKNFPSSLNALLAKKAKMEKKGEGNSS